MKFIIVLLVVVLNSIIQVCAQIPTIIDPAYDVRINGVTINLIARSSNTQGACSSGYTTTTLAELEIWCGNAYQTGGSALSLSGAGFWGPDGCPTPTSTSTTGGIRCSAFTTSNPDPSGTSGSKFTVSKIKSRGRSTSKVLKRTKKVIDFGYMGKV